MPIHITAERVKDGKTVRLSNNEDRWQLLEVEGLSTPEATISSFDIASLDGVKVNHIKMAEREIVISLAINGGTDSVENNRQMLYDLFRIRDVIRLHIKTRNRNVFCDCYVKRNTCNNFEDHQVMDITLLNPTPYFNNENAIVENTSKRVALFEFPFAIEHDEPVEISTFDPQRSAIIMSESENDTGIIITATFNLVSASKLAITNEDTGEFMIFQYGFQSGDRLDICTIKGQKEALLYRGGDVINMIPYLQTDSNWFQLQAGSNSFNYVVDDTPDINTVDMEFTYREIFYAI